MKKLIISIVVAAVAVMCNAASVDWKVTAGNMYASNGTSKYTGTFNLYATGGDLAADVLVYTLANVSNGTIANQAFSTTTLTVGESYSFYFVLDDGGKSFTSDLKTGLTAAATGATPINFGNMQSATQNASNWKGSSPVPEPTSGLLLLLGVAGLALKRKRA